MRELIKWLMDEDLDCLGFLIRHGILHVGGDLFPPCTHEWQLSRDTCSEAESLLSLAAKDVCSPAAVRLLLDHGADPNGMMTPLFFNGNYLPECGPGGLACLDVSGGWGAPVQVKLAILTALAEAGGEMFDAWNEYYRCEQVCYEAEQELCWTLLRAEEERKDADGRQRLETIVALVGIVSLLAARHQRRPTAKAAIAAIARVARRARRGGGGGGGGVCAE